MVTIALTDMQLAILFNWGRTAEWESGFDIADYHTLLTLAQAGAAEGLVQEIQRKLDWMIAREQAQEEQSADVAIMSAQSAREQLDRKVKRHQAYIKRRDARRDAR